MMEILILSLISFLLIGLHHFISKKIHLHFGAFLVLSIAVSSCITALYFTNFQSILLIAFVGFLYFIFRFSRKNILEKSINYTQDYLYFYLSLIVFWAIMQMLYSPYETKDYQLFAYEDFVYYFNKIQLISQTGVENVNQSAFDDTQLIPFFYHYGDLWFYKIMSFFLKWISLEHLLLFVIMPFLSAISSQVMLLILRQYFPSHFKLYLIAFLPSIFVAFIELSPNAGAAGLCQNSALNHTKDTFLLCFLLLMFFYHQFSDRRWVYYTFALSVFFVNIAPAVLGFYALVSLIDVIKTRKISKFYISEIVFVLLIALYFVYFYKDSLFLPKSDVADAVVVPLVTKIVRLIAYVRDFVFSLMMYAPVILVIAMGLVFGKNYKMLVFPKKIALLFFLFPIGLLLVCATFYGNVDSFQLLSNLVPSLMALIFCVVLAQIASTKYLYFGVLLIATTSLFEARNFTYLMISNIDDKSVLENKRSVSNTDMINIINFAGKDAERSFFISKFNREIWTNPESNIDNYFIYKFKFPFYSTMLEMKDFEALKKYKQFNQLKNSYLQTPFAKFYFKGNYTNVVDAQLDFLKKYRVKLLFTDFDYQLSSKIKSKASDSLIISENKLKIYRFP